MWFWHSWRERGLTSILEFSAIDNLMPRKREPRTDGQQIKCVHPTLPKKPNLQSGVWQKLDIWVKTQTTAQRFEAVGKLTWQLWGGGQVEECQPKRGKAEIRSFTGLKSVSNWVCGSVLRKPSGTQPIRTRILRQDAGVSRSPKRRRSRRYWLKLPRRIRWNSDVQRGKDCSLCSSHSRIELI